MPFAFDPLWLLLMLPGMAVSGWAQSRILGGLSRGLTLSGIVGSDGGTGRRGDHAVWRSRARGHRAGGRSVDRPL